MSAEKFDAKSCKVLFSGNSGTGKTTLLHKIVAKEKARYKFVYDHKHGEFAKKFNVQACYSGEELDDAVARGGWVVFDPIEMFEGKPEEGFRFFCAYVFEVCKNFPGKKLFICDELQKIIDTRLEPDELLVILDTGRVYQIDCYMITNATNGIHNRVRNQITEVYAFRQGDKRSAEWLIEKGFEPVELFTLKNYAWQWRNLDTGETRESGKKSRPDSKGAGSPPATDPGRNVESRSE